MNKEEWLAENARRIKAVIDSEKKPIRLVPEDPYFNHVKVGVYDYIGRDDATGISEDQRAEADRLADWRLRCTIDVEYGDYDIKDLRRKLLSERSEGASEEITLADAMEYYREWMHALVKQLLSSDWEAVAGENEVLGIVRDHICDDFADNQ